MLPEVVGRLVLDRESVATALRRRRRAARTGLADGLLPGLDPEIDRELRDVSLLAEMDRELRALLSDAGWRPAAAAIGLELPEWLAAELPSEQCRQVVALRRDGRSWRQIERQTGVRAGNAAAMAGDVARVVRLWPRVVQSRRAGMGRREIARRFGLPRWGVRAILEHAPPKGGGRPTVPAGCGVSAEVGENGRTPAGGRSHVAPGPAPGAGWRMLRTEPGCAVRVKAEIERRCEARYGPGWPRQVRCLAPVAAGGRPVGGRPTATARPACDGLLAIAAHSTVDLDDLLRELPHARGWIGWCAADAGDRGGHARRRPLLVPAGEVAAWFRRLGWEGVPEARS